MRKKRNPAAKLIRGDRLTADQIRQVKQAFVHRMTVENERERPDVARMMRAHGYRMPPISDAEWIKQHAFHFTRDGRLAERGHAEPSYLAEENPFDLSSLTSIIGAKPITVKLQKVAGQIQLRIEKPTKELLHRLGLRKSANPRSRKRNRRDEPMIDCEICGRIHQDIDVDCRAFKGCEKCGDAYHFENLPAHLKKCKGIPSSNIRDTQDPTVGSGNPSVGWNVYLNRKWIDKVFYDASYKTADEVKQSLVDHDGYDPHIKVVKERKSKR